MYSDLDVFFTDPVSERAIIPDHKYCFQMSIIIFARLNVDSTYTTDKPNLSKFNILLEDIFDLKEFHLRRKNR